MQLRVANGNSSNELTYGTHVALQLFYCNKSTAHCTAVIALHHVMLHMKNTFEVQTKAQKWQSKSYTNHSAAGGQTNFKWKTEVVIIKMTGGTPEVRSVKINLIDF